VTAVPSKWTVVPSGAPAAPATRQVVPARSTAGALPETPVDDAGALADDAAEALVAAASPPDAPLAQPASATSRRTAAAGTGRIDRIRIPGSVPRLRLPLTGPPRIRPRHAAMPTVIPQGGTIGRMQEGHVGYVGNKDELLKRLRRAEGQVRGIQRMVEDDTYCIDVLTQVSAATKALETVALALLDDHLAHCVAEASAEGGPVAEEKLREASAAIARLVR
jgi:DNA-binding FrmR family transcriptional regulator